MCPQIEKFIYYIQHRYYGEQKPDIKGEKKMKVRGRSTKMGAHTAVVPVEGDIKIKEYNFSRTGNHWNISVQGDGIVDVIDISNSGKHHCKRLRIKDREVVETIFTPHYSRWDVCPICKKVACV